MPKRPLSPQPCGHSNAAKRGNHRDRRQQPRPRHVYLVVDDWERGYSVRKIDVGTFSPQAEAAPEPEQLPDPAVARFEGHHGRLAFFGAHGTKILAMPAYGAADFPVYDVETSGITLCAHPNGRKICGPPLLASVAGKLYMIVESSLAVLDAPPQPNGDECKTWAWTFLPAHLPPFQSPDVKSLAVHPDGRTLFVTARRRTFSLDTRSLEWTCQGNWAMPFSGEAYFDQDLDAWVGLCIHEGGFGHVCSCDAVPAVAAGVLQTMPAWKLGKDRLFHADRERHLGATLLFMGDGSYCLLECASADDQDEDEYAAHRVYHVTTFGLQYDKDGELRATRRRAHSYEMTDAHEMNELYKRPTAFWM
ncbi:hypothetical protein CFC21_099083 [Triticum aestivum]|uniref:DUF295 domain-containing protein n=2 Tax=Triticum aestivum TaxID=4565 RepID=A0A3B6RNC4_WHEAT|nr:hypothetical protein CFC21_099083 [Triticum aestivum]